MAFARYKGEAETTLLAAGFPVCTYSGLHTSIPWSLARSRISATCCARSIPRSVLFPNQVIPADELGRGMVDVVVGRKAGREARIFENRDIREPLVKS
jgi:hypothetical protein